MRPCKYRIIIIKYLGEESARPIGWFRSIWRIKRGYVCPLNISARAVFVPFNSLSVWNRNGRLLLISDTLLAVWRRWKETRGERRLRVEDKTAFHHVFESSIDFFLDCDFGHVSNVYNDIVLFQRPDGKGLLNDCSLLSSDRYAWIF